MMNSITETSLLQVGIKYSQELSMLLDDPRNKVLVQEFERIKAENKMLQGRRNGWNPQ